MNADTLNEISQLKADNALLAQALADCHIEIERLHKLNLKAEPAQGYCPRCGMPKAANCDCWNPNNET